MKTGDTVNNWVDSLQAAWSALQVGKQIKLLYLFVYNEEKLKQSIRVKIWWWFYT